MIPHVDMDAFHAAVEPRDRLLTIPKTSENGIVLRHPEPATN